MEQALSPPPLTRHRVRAACPVWSPEYPKSLARMWSTRLATISSDQHTGGLRASLSGSTPFSVTVDRGIQRRRRGHSSIVELLQRMSPFV